MAGRVFGRMVGVMTDRRLEEWLAESLTAGGTSDWRNDWLLTEGVAGGMFDCWHDEWMT